MKQIKHLALQIPAKCGKIRNPRATKSKLSPPKLAHEERGARGRHDEKPQVREQREDKRLKVMMRERSAIQRMS